MNRWSLLRGRGRSTHERKSLAKNTVKQLDSDSEVMVCFGTKSKLSVDHTVIASYTGLGIYLTSLS